VHQPVGNPIGTTTKGWTRSWRRDSSSPRRTPMLRWPLSSSVHTPRASTPTTGDQSYVEHPDLEMHAIVCQMQPHAARDGTRRCCAGAAEPGRGGIVPAAAGGPSRRRRNHREVCRAMEASGGKRSSFITFFFLEREEERISFFLVGHLISVIGYQCYFCDGNASPSWFP
jgi:hypothetical protein